MARKKPVNLLVQTLLIAVPIPLVWLFASYRVEKLIWAILILALGGILSWLINSYIGIENAPESTVFVYESMNLRIHLISFFYIASFYTIFIYLIRQWSQRWNEQLSEIINLKNQTKITKKNNKDVIISIFFGFTITILLWTSFGFESDVEDTQNTEILFENTTKIEQVVTSETKSKLDPCLDPNLMYSSILKCR